MGTTSFSASHFAFFLRSNRDKEIILESGCKVRYISLFDLRTRPWGVLHYNYYILPIMTRRFESEQVRNRIKEQTLKKNSKSSAAGSNLVTFSSSAFMESWSRWTEIWVWTLIQGGWLVHTTMMIVQLCYCQALLELEPPSGRLFPTLCGGGENGHAIRTESQRCSHTCCH